MKRITLLLSIIFAFNFKTASAQWVQTNGPYSGTVLCFGTMANSSGGTNIYAGTLEGLYDLSGSGSGWVLIGNSLKGSYVFGLAVSVSNLFAATSRGVYLSTDEGVTWQLVDVGLPYVGATAIAAEGSYLFVSQGTQGVYISSSNGSVWTQADSGLINLGDKIVRCFAVNGNNVYAGTDNGVFVSTNNGTSWEEGTGLTISEGGYVTSLAVSGYPIFAGTSFNGVFLSTDNGTSWSPVNAGLQSTDILALIAVQNGSTGTKIFAATGAGLSLSTNNGTTWNRFGKGFPITSAQAMETVPNDEGGITIYAGTQNMGVFTSTDTGATWQDVSEGFGLSYIGSIEGIPTGSGGSQLICGTSGQGAFTSSDQGASWMPVAGLPNPYVTSFTTTTNGSVPPTIYAGTDGQGVYVSNDYGSTWTIDTAGFGYSIPFSGNLNVNSLIAVNYGTGSEVVFAATSPGIYRSVNGGRWSEDTSGMGYEVYAFSFGASRIGSNQTDIYAGIIRGVFVSSDTGSTWVPIDTGIVTLGKIRLIYSLATLVDGTGGLHLFAGAIDTGLYESSTDGQIWSKVSYSPLADSQVNCMAESGTNIFVGTTSHLYLSTDFGSTWAAVDSGLPRTPIESLYASSTELYAGTSDDGLWRRPLSDMITAINHDLSNNRPKSFSLDQNYPNPFNPTTTINYQLPTNGLVTLKVYDILGREVATLVNEKQNRGNYSVTFNASRLASGVYFYRLAAGSFVSVKKLMLVK